MEGLLRPAARLEVNSTAGFVSEGMSVSSGTMETDI